MAGRGKPPEGPVEGVPGGGDDEYRSVVFDESFVDAARLQEYSAQERMDDEDHAAVRSRPPSEEPPARSASRQGLVLVLLIVLAFGTAVYMGVRNPLPDPDPPPAQPARMATVPLAPRDAVPGSTPEDLFAHSPAAAYRTGADGVTLPSTYRTDHFTENQVLAALTGAKDYVVASSLDPAVLTGGEVRSVRLMLDPGQGAQFERSVDRPRSDGRHALTGWMVRFDPGRVALAAPEVRVNGTLSVEEIHRNTLEVTADHVFVYALHPQGSADASDASLFTVRREVRFHFHREDLTEHQLQVRSVSVRAGPMACSAGHADTLVPLLAGERAGDDLPAGTDPYARDDPRGAVCGVLARSAMPDPARTG
ncbi:hypothetical protein E4198_18910 [Streptomyces sp. RKND-216]|uniref:SCO2583 family membrane protein n=1 Tax=Streptomyces sp. RKND-216 TaxID=2562581 RepID=UPI00109DA79E|nr:hypothetical protein [Streptomyces sp. RKND-216]THA26475.1 hypothetical protein E4198_18910 [Streptomyces sp. RKND-216]